MAPPSGGDEFGIEPGLKVRDLVADSDPFPQYVTPEEMAGGGILPIQSHTFAPATGGQTVFVVPVEKPVTAVLFVNHDGAVFVPSQGQFSVDEQIITMLFGSEAEAVVSVLFQ